MEKKLGLSETEYELMEIFWEQAKPLSFADVLYECNQVRGHQWAKTTVHTFLTRMIQKGVLDTVPVGKRHHYLAARSKSEQLGLYTWQFVSRNYNGSVSKMLRSLSENGYLSSQERKACRKILTK